MAWVKKPGVNINDDTIPRKLTILEIEDIILVIPTVLAATKRAAEVATNVIRNKLKSQLFTIDITPAGIPALKKQIERSFHLSQVEPQDTVGMAAAEALGQTVTQIALKSFHTSGSGRNIAGGIDAMSEMIDANKNRKYESTVIYFKDKTLSYMDVVRKRRTLVGLSVKDIVDDYVIQKPENLEKFWWHDTYLALNKKTLPNSTEVLRLYLKVDLLYQHHVSMEAIATVLDDEAPPHVVCVYSSIREGIIDIYPDPKYIMDTITKKNIKDPIVFPELIFLDVIILPALKNLIIQGIPKIKSIYPVAYPVWTIVQTVSRVYQKDDLQLRDYPDRKDFWYIILNPLQMHLTGVGFPEMRNLLTTFGIQIIQEYNTNVSPYIIVNCPKAPDEIIRNKLTEEEEADIQFFEDIRMKKDLIIRNPLSSKYITASRIYFVETHGINLRQILSQPDVDTLHTYSNNMHEMANVLGILASKNLHIRELTTMIANADGFVNPRHIEIISSFIHCYGIPVGINFAGLYKQSNDHISLATFQRSGYVFLKAAEAGQVAHLRDTSSALVMGKMPLLGSNGMDVEMTEAYKEVFKLHMKQQKLEEIEVASNIVKWLDDVKTNLVSNKEEIVGLPIPKTDVERKLSRLIGPIGRKYTHSEANKPLRSEALMKLFGVITFVEGQVNIIPRIRGLPHGLLVGKIFQDLFNLYIDTNVDIKLPAFDFIEVNTVNPIIETTVPFAVVPANFSPMILKI